MSTFLLVKTAAGVLSYLGGCRIANMGVECIKDYAKLRGLYSAAKANSFAVSLGKWGLASAAGATASKHVINDIETVKELIDKKKGEKDNGRQDQQGDNGAEAGDQGAA